MDCHEDHRGSWWDGRPGVTGSDPDRAAGGFEYRMPERRGAPPVSPAGSALSGEGGGSAWAGRSGAVLDGVEAVGEALLVGFEVG